MRKGTRAPFSVVLLTLLLVFVAACGTSGDQVGVDTNQPENDGNVLVDTADGIPADFSGDTGSKPDGEVQLDSEVTVNDTLDIGEDVSDLCAGPGEFMCSCVTGKDCISGYCVESTYGKVCSRSCVEDCPEGWDCLPEKDSGADPVFLCLQRNIYLCKPCNSNDECQSPYSETNDMCIEYGENGSYCAVDCTTRPCPEGYTCADILTEEMGSVKQCMVDGGECKCTPQMISQASSTVCEKSNGAGTCLGERICTAQGLTECSALTPKPEICNGIDDDCDGVTDPANSNQCINWYQDSDADGYGQGAGVCECEKPASTWVSQGGDCNDSAFSINPGKREACNGVDDNCDGIIDESYADGCITMYFDGDGDGVGDSTKPDCRCEHASGFAEVGGDCDDQNPSIGPGDSETCDGIDNDCDSIIDEEDASGCTPYFLDQDGDTYGLSDQYKCLCKPLGDYKVKKGGDCDDTNANTYPTVNELCDGKDNDCDGQTDEGEAASTCGIVAHGDVACNAGCVITGCESGWYDLNSSYADGCECQKESGEVVGQTCSDATSLGELADTGTSNSKTARIVPAGDTDWYKFKAVDETDINSCDTFHIRVRFLKNPNDNYVFDVFYGGCGGANNICSGASYFEFFTDFHENIKDPSIGGGECPCKPNVNTNPNETGPEENFHTNDTSDSSHQCKSQTTWVYVKVYRKDLVTPACEDYQIEVSNGINVGTP